MAGATPLERMACMALAGRSMYTSFLALLSLGSPAADVSTGSGCVCRSFFCLFSSSRCSVGSSRRSRVVCMSRSSSSPSRAARRTARNCVQAWVHRRVKWRGQSLVGGRCARGLDASCNVAMMLRSPSAVGSVESLGTFARGWGRQGAARSTASGPAAVAVERVRSPASREAAHVSDDARSSIALFACRSASRLYWRSTCSKVTVCPSRSKSSTICCAVCCSATSDSSLHFHLPSICLITSMESPLMVILNLTAMSALATASCDTAWRALMQPWYSAMLLVAHSCTNTAWSDMCQIVSASRTDTVAPAPARPGLPLEPPSKVATMVNRFVGLRRESGLPPDCPAPRVASSPVCRASVWGRRVAAPASVAAFVVGGETFVVSLAPRSFSAVALASLLPVPDAAKAGASPKVVVFTSAPGLASASSSKVHVLSASPS